MKKIIRDFLIVIFVLSLIGLDQGFVLENTPEIDRQVEEFVEGKDVPNKEFWSDGCTLWPDSVLGIDWQDSCIKHDISYWLGGGEDERLIADKKLRDEINAIIPGIGNIVYLGVRIGGQSFFPFWGWGGSSENDESFSEPVESP